MSKNNDAQKRAVLKYKASKLKRIPLDVQLSYYDETLKPHCDALGLPVNTFIKLAIQEKIDRDLKNE